MEITRQEFQEWKNHAITKEVFLEVRQRIEDCKEILGATAGIDPDKDRLMCGMIQAFRDILEIDVETSE